MKVFIKFDLPEEQEEYKTFNNAGKYLCVLCDFDNWLRSNIKYEDKDWDDIRDKLHEFLDAFDVSLY